MCFNEAGVRDAGDPTRTSYFTCSRRRFNEAGVRDAGDLHHIGSVEPPLCRASTRPACETPEIARAGRRLAPGPDGFNEAGVRDAGDHVMRIRCRGVRIAASTRPACETPEIRMARSRRRARRGRFNEAGVRDAGDRATHPAPPQRLARFNEAGVRDAGDLGAVVEHLRPKIASTRPACETPEISRSGVCPSTNWNASTRLSKCISM